MAMIRSIALAIIAFLAILFPASAADVAFYEDEVVSVRLLQTPCELPAIAAKLAELAPSPRTAAVRFEGRDLAACWIADVLTDRVLVLDEAGTGGVFQLSAFGARPKPKKGLTL